MFATGVFLYICTGSEVKLAYCTHAVLFAGAMMHFNIHICKSLSLLVGIRSNDLSVSDVEKGK